MKEYKIIDCERSVLKAVIESDEKLGWNLFQAVWYENYVSEDKRIHRMYTLFYSREKE